MTRILAFVGLLGLQIVLVTCADKDVYDEGSTMKLQAPITEKITQCFITSSQGREYELFPNNSSPGSYDGNGKRCTIIVRDIRVSYGGIWSMETVTENERFKNNFTVKVKQTTISRPADDISSAAGQWATVWLDSDRDDLVSCNVTDSQDRIHNLMEDQIENLTRFHGCGVRMLISPERQGQWTFSAQFGNYLIKTALFEISIPKERKHNKIRHESWLIGQPATLNMYELGVIYCKLTRPDGTELPIMFKSCSHDISVVRSYHSGIWKAAYARAEKMELNYVDINVTTTDPNLLESSLTRRVENEVNLLCRTAAKHMDLCTFIRPDKQVINVIAGLGNDKYSYYGKGYQEADSSSREYGECGLTIHNPSEEDFGLWTCEMSIDGKIQGTGINVAKTQITEQVNKIDSPKVFVKRGHNFKIQCSTNAVLSYCWLTSPDGTAYSVSPTGGLGKTLEYDGKGFSKGECGAIVKNASDTDNGMWTCHLGIKNEAEIEATVAAKVTDTYLIASEDTVYARTKPRLTCRTILGDEGTLQYCRWVRPTGHGINKEEAWRYDWNIGMSDCSLTITRLEPEDIGQWQCVALLSKSSGDEEWATVNLKAVDDETRTAISWSIGLGSGILVIALIGVIFAVMHLCKKRNAGIIKSPPPYCAPDYCIPRAIQTRPELNVQSKDYVH